MKEVAIKPLVAMALLALSIIALPLRSRAQHQEAERKGVRGFIDEEMMRRDLIENPMPQYPEAALKTGAHGEVIIAVIFKEDGTLEKAAVLASPHPEIIRSVLEALKNWKTGRYFVGPGADPLREVSWLSLDFEIVDGKGQVGYARRGPDDTKNDKRYVHPFAGKDVGPFWYQYTPGYN
ncbi:MAG: TonB family protein [Blastocatellia bacterium]